MVCASCGWATQASARFCGGCGASLAQSCPACRAECQPGARFCEGCGASLAAGPAEAAVARKVVTIVFADLIGSTALHERLDPESVSRIMEGYHAAVRAPIEAQGGTVVQLLGDGVMCAFGIPRVAEDDALRAVRAAVDVQRSFRDFMSEHPELTGRVGLRVAVNTGEVVVSDDYTAGIGDPLNVAARLQQEAKDGDVLIGESTQRLVAERVTLARVGSFALKGRAEPVTAYRVVSLERPAGAAAVAFVGRDDELRRITAVYDAALAAPAARLAVLLGSPGLGKSRLLAEFARRLGERATVLSVQCNAGTGATFAPLAEALRAQLRVEESGSAEALRAVIDGVVPGEDAERARIASGVGALLAGAPASPEETFFVVRRLLAALAAERPLVLALDDVQWAEPLLLDFTEHLVQWGAGIPLLVLAAARPELRETRSSLTTSGGLVSDVVTLTGLDAGAAMRLAGNVIGTGTLPAAVAGRVLATSEGNPLFVSELIRMLVNDGALRKEGERWILAVDLAALEIPPTIQALLAARIERLRPEERLVLERAAVVGRQFSRAAVTHLLPREAHADLDARLEALRRGELIEADAGWLLGEPALRFHHVLIRDAAYRRVLRGTRAELHERFADWLETRAGASAPPGETLGWHLEQAHQQLRELGPLDAAGRTLGERAARYLAAAGRAALARDDLPPAAGLLGRALDCLGDADPARAELALDWCEALLSAGDVAPAARAIAELGRFTTGSERLSAWHTCFSGQLAALADPKALRASAAAVAAAAEALAAAGDVAGEAKAHQVHAEALGRLGKIGASEAALDKALAAARRVRGERRRANAVLAGIPLAALWGPSPVTRASGRCLDVVRVLRITEGAPAVEAVALRCQAVLETLRGRSDAARRMIASSRRMVEELGITQRLLEADQFAGLIELLEGDAVAAERWLRAAYEGFREHGLGVAAAQAAALLGRALLAEGRAVEAEALSHESEALAGDDFKAAIAWRGVRAETLAGRGESAAAVDLARTAVEIAAATDDPLDHADARSALAVALRAAGRSGEADTEALRALELWEQKGATLLAERARRGVARVAPAERAPGARVERPRPEPRRVGANRATEAVARLDAAIAARDADALDALIAAGSQAVQHPVGFSETMLSLYSTALGLRNQTWLHEPLGTLGDSLALFGSSVSGSEVARGNFDVGAYDLENPVLIEVDADGRCSGAEFFAAERLGAAIARLYERYAEQLPDGSERARAAATARSVEALMGPPEHWPFAPDAEATDPRTVGFGSVSGRSDVMKVIRTLTIDLTEGFATRADDILGLRSGALLVRWTTTGIVRVSGGAFERNTLMLWVFGADGLISRWEQLDAEREAEALARFDELTAAPPTVRPVRRRVRANAGTEWLARANAAIRAGDLDAISSLHAEALRAEHHLTGLALDREEVLAYWRLFFVDRGTASPPEPIAVLGDALVLYRDMWTGGSPAAGLDVGPFEHDVLGLAEVDTTGRAVRIDVFATNRLADAVARLYERRAELVTDDPERGRAAAIARSVAAWNGPFDLDRVAACLAPSVELVDHRILGTWSVRGAEEFLRHWRAQLDVSDVHVRDHEVLALERAAFLVRRSWFGTARARVGGGVFENVNLDIFVFGADGLLARIEVFDPDSEAVALARFEELAAEPPPTARRRVRPNGGTAHADRVNAALLARDADRLAALLSDGVQIAHHPTGAALSRQETLDWWRLLFTRDRDFAFQLEPVATLGPSLALCRQCWSGSGYADAEFDVGPFQRDAFSLIEGDAEGRAERIEVFAPDHLRDAVVRLYERYAERLPEGAERDRAAQVARSVAHSVGPWDLERAGATLAPVVESVDYRTLGTWSAQGKQAWLEQMRALAAVAEGIVLRDDDVLGLRSGALLVQRVHLGTDRASGGVYERPYLMLQAFDAGGLAVRFEWFDADREAEALARFDELTAEARPVRRRVRGNAATANAARLDAAIARRDADALLMLMAEDGETIDHSNGTTYGRSGTLAFYRRQFRVPDLRVRHEPLATLGDGLALFRQAVSGSGAAGKSFDVGPFEFDNIMLFEVDARGSRRRLEIFATDRLGAAIARLYERYAELLPAGRERTRAAATARSVAGWLGPFDLERFGAAVAPAIDVIDHRTLGTWSAHGKEAWLEHMRALVAVAEGIVLRDDDVLGLRPGALLVQRVHRGTDRASGGSYERAYLQLMAFDADGLVTRQELFDADRDGEALARFDELTAESPPTPRRVRANLATANAARQDAAIAARDAGALATLVAGECDVLDHTIGIPYDRSGLLASWQSLLRAREPRYRHEPLATLGDVLALCRLSVSASGLATQKLDIGAYETEKMTLLEVDAEGRLRRTEGFALDRLGDAIVRLYERYAELLPEGPERARAAGAARLVAACRTLDLDRVAESIAADVEFVDHRALGFPRTVGAEAYLRRLASLGEVATDVAVRIEDVLALGADAFLVRWVNYGIDRAGGGAFEVPFLLLFVFGADGLVTHNEAFEVDRAADALARFDELTGAKPETPFANAAWRVLEEEDRAMERRDWEGLVARYAPGYVFDDRRSLVRTRVDGDASLANLRLLFDARRGLSRQLLATRGERLELDRQLRTSVDRHGGLAEFEYLCLNEVDATGRITGSVVFDPGDLDAAYAELDARYAAGEAAPYARTLASIGRFRAALAARDWAGLAQLIAPDLVWGDHRLLGLHDLRSRGEYLARVRSLIDLAPDAALRAEHMLALDERGVLAVLCWVGSRDGGAFEIPAVSVIGSGADGWVRALDTYDIGQLDEARACFAALAAAPPAPWLDNAATRSERENDAAWGSRDWERFVALHAPGFRRSDRRRLFQLELTREEHLEIARLLFEMESTQTEWEPLATRGDRLALVRWRFEGSNRDVGPSVIESLSLFEVDARGEFVALVMFDLDDPGAAYAELDDRYGATKVPVLVLRSIDARDWDAVAALLAPDFVIEDHRLLGWGTLHGPAAYIESLQALVELAPDAKLRFDHREDSGRGALGITMLWGTREGGAFEDRRVVITELDARGKLHRLDIYDLEQLAEARARFDALAASAQRDPLAALIQPNAASATLDRLQAAFDAHDSAAMRALAAEGARFEDRRRHALVSGDVDWWLADLRQVAEAEVGDVHYQRTLFATAGDRVCLERVLFAGGPAEGRVEIEYLWLAEVDESGRLVAGVMFDVDDWRAANREAAARWLARDVAAAALLGPVLETFDGWNDHDRARVRASVADDLVSHDRRLAGVGRLEGADAYMDSLAVLWEMAPDIQIEMRSALALERHGVVGVARNFGTLPEGGAFEIYGIIVATLERGLVTRLELFEIEQLDAALARFAELRPDPLRIPPNSATRASDLRHAAWQARDWDALRALASPDFVFEDRSRISRVSGDVEMWIENNRFVEPAPTERELIGTAGDRVALERVLWRGEPDGAPVEREHLRLTEVDADGRIRASLRFDPDDRAAAFADAHARFVAGEASAVGGQEPIVGFFGAFARHDWDSMRACLAEDAVIWDRRALGILGTLDREGWVESLRAIADLAPDWGAEVVRILTWNPLGRVHLSRTFGTRDGGPFENLFAGVFLIEGDRIQRYEFFDLTDADRALARFSELCGGGESQEG